MSRHALFYILTGLLVVVFLVLLLALTASIWGWPPGFEIIQAAWE